MKDFIEYLNSASIDELSAISGITRPVAESIIAARPFSSLADCDRVKGFTAKKMEVVRAAFESTLSDNSSVVVEKDTEIAVSQEAPIKKSSVAGILLRVLLALLILGAVFVLIYFGIPWFKEKVLNPLQTNTEGLNQVASQQAANMESLSAQIAVLQGRVATLEARADSVNQSIQAHTEALQKLDELQAALQAGFETHMVEISSQLSEQLTLTRAIELLSRSRLYLSQSNFGLAKTDAISARELLYGLLTTISPEQSGALRIVIDRLDLALTNIEAYPAIAVYDLDMAWRLLIDGLPNVPQMVLTPVIAETLPPTALPPATATPTLVP
jgi:hypothetical protein